MTYSKAPVRYVNRKVRLRDGRVVTKRVAMGDNIWDVVNRYSNASDSDANNADQLRCIDQANNSPAAKQIDARIADLNANWNPTGIFTGDQITKLINMLASLTTEARASLIPLPSNSYGIGNARAYLDINDARIEAYRVAVAKSGGAKIPAPDLKSEYIKSLVNVWNAIITVQVVTCQLTTGQRFAMLLGRAADLAKSILGALLEFGEKAADAIKAPLNILGWLGRYPYVPIGIAAIILFKRFGVKV